MEKNSNTKISESLVANWWERFKKGEKKAFEYIYNGHVDFLYSYGRGLTNNTVLIEDSIQDLFLYLYSKQETIITPVNIRFYLLKAFKRILLDKLKNDLRSNVHFEDESFYFNFEVDTEGVIKKQLQEKKIALVEKLIDELEPRKKEVIYLKFKSGLNYTEIAEIVGIKPASAKKIVYRTISTFREIVKNKSFELFSILIRSVKA